MPIWKQDSPPSKETAGPAPEPSREIETRGEGAPAASARPRSPERSGKESLIAAEITIEGKIEGSGHVRIAGRFKGDVHVQGNLAIEPGATLTGGVRASTVTIGGSLEGNIDGADRVELLETGVLNGDLSADSLTVAAGSRMRGKVEFGWERKAALTLGSSERSAAATRMKAESAAAP
jgi:cytoskeletal protein CcmA (bactofilin family)